MKTASHDWIVRDWYQAMQQDTAAAWNNVWYKLFGARRLAVDLGLDRDENSLWAELALFSDLAHSHAIDAAERGRHQ